MRNALLEQSCKITESFLNSILFIDDETTYANDENGIHSLKAKPITQEFVKKQMNSVFFKYEKTNEKNIVLSLIEQNDVCVLDWKLVLTHDSLKLSEAEGEEDVSEANSRGKYAIELITEIISKQSSTPKLIIIYSAEVGNEIPARLQQLQGGKYDNYTWMSNDDNIRIVVYFKPPLKTAHIGSAIRNRIVEYDALPQITIEEFAHLHYGLLPSAMLKSIAAIRANTNLLLAKYNKKLDIAYIIHRAMCPNPDDAEKLLTTTISDAFDAILSYVNLPATINPKVIKAWLSSQDGNVNHVIKVNKKDLIIGKMQRSEWQITGYPNFIPKYFKLQKNIELDDGKLCDYDTGSLKKDVIRCFSHISVGDGIHEDFAILTHHKSNFKGDSDLPVLTLGTVVEVVTSSDSKFFICIQQKCDSLRLTKDEIRNFIFLPLTKVDGEKKFELIYKNSNNIHRFVINKKHCHDITLIPFKATRNQQFVIAKKDRKGKLFFKDANGHKYLWLFDLKESHAQKIINEYAATLARVAIEQSEWLRRQ